MEWINRIFFLIATIGGILIGHYLWPWKWLRTDGELIVDTSDPRKDIYRLELGNHLEKLAVKKTITLKIVRKQLSHKKHSL